MIEYFSHNLWVFWLVTAVAFLILETLTTALVSIWFVPGAVIASLVSVFSDSFALQIVVFLVLSAVCFLLCKKFYKPNKATKLGEANDLLVGKTAIAKTDINSIDGKVLVGDVYWRAVADEEISQGVPVEIMAVNGTVLSVAVKK